MMHIITCVLTGWSVVLAAAAWIVYCMAKRHLDEAERVLRKARALRDRVGDG